MGNLKPIGSEKLTGQSKIERMLQIARFKENIPTSLNETAKSEFNIGLADGNKYEIVKEKQGYIVKKTISESETEYIEPIKNRKYHSSYSQALKRLNLLAAEINRITENQEGTSLFGEQKKFVLKTPKADSSDTGSTPAAPPPPIAPPPVPEPQLPPSPVGGDMAPPMDSAGDMNLPDGGETGDVTGTTPGEFGGDEFSGETPDDLQVPDEGKDEKVSFRSIQKITGKLTQKLRMLDNDEGMTSENIKYVINMVLSAVNLNELSDEDKEDILSKFEGEDFGGEFEGEDFGGDDMTTEPELGNELPQEPEGEMMEKSYGSIIDSIFSESKVDKVLSKYFEFTKREINEQRKKNTNSKKIYRGNLQEVVRLSESVEQELASSKFLEENNNYKFLGKTNKKNLVFERNGVQIKITPKGFVI